MIDSHVEDLVDPIYTALKHLSEDQLGDLADALHRLQIAVDEELMRREHGEEAELEGEDGEEDADRW